MCGTISGNIIASTKAEIKPCIEENFGYDLSRTCDEIWPGYCHGKI